MKLWLNGTLILITSIHPKTKSQYDMHYFQETLVYFNNTRKQFFKTSLKKEEDFLQNLLQKSLILTQNASKDRMKFGTKISLKSLFIAYFIWICIPPIEFIRVSGENPFIVFIWICNPPTEFIRVSTKRIHPSLWWESIYSFHLDL